MNTQKTHMECKVFNIVAGQYLMRTKSKANKLEEKFSEKIKVVGREIEKAEKTFELKKRDIDIDHALTEDGTPNGALLKDKDGNYKFGREGEKTRRKALDKLLTEKVSIEVQLIDNYKAIIPLLNETEKEVFAGFVLPPLNKK